MSLDDLVVGTAAFAALDALSILSLPYSQDTEQTWLP